MLQASKSDTSTKPENTHIVYHALGLTIESQLSLPAVSLMCEMIKEIRLEASIHLFQPHVSLPTDNMLLLSWRQWGRPTPFHDAKEAAG